MSGKFFNLITITALALVASSFAPTPVDALSTGHAQHLNRHYAHDAMAKRKRDATPRRCKQRPTSSIVSSSHAAQSTSPVKVSVSVSAAVHTAKATSSVHSDKPSSSAQSVKASSTSHSSAKPAATSASSSGSSGSSGSSSGGKVCLGWGNGPDVNLAEFVGPAVSSLYTWSSSGPSNTDGLDFMPMLWGSSKTSGFEADVKSSASSTRHVLLGPNEPNQDGQSDMSPQAACDLYHAHLVPKLSLGYQLVSPAVTSASSGFTWMSDFLSCCSDCGISGLAVHWYGLKADDFQSFISEWHSKHPSLPIYITEYAVHDFVNGQTASLSQVKEFYKTVNPWMNGQDYVHKFCPFGFLKESLNGVNEANRMMDSSGHLTDLGRAVINNDYSSI
ncbi:glycosyl hydrolase catalytic core-domain-containing protein [Abortiporus biennis]|nr:glycosyl hydrolase catalytic core-domain-containing protein [Abortiporus biennis]